MTATSTPRRQQSAISPTDKGEPDMTTTTTTTSAPASTIGPDGRSGDAPATDFAQAAVDRSTGNPARRAGTGHSLSGLAVAAGEGMGGGGL